MCLYQQQNISGISLYTFLVKENMVLLISMQYKWIHTFSFVLWLSPCMQYFMNCVLEYWEETNFGWRVVKQFFL